MNIITWNANRKKRYDLIWTDTLVKRWAWDVICLQEAGNPAREWGNPQKGRAWQAKKQRTPSDKPLEARWYSYTPPGFPQVYIVHGQWVNHDKNHLVVITKNEAPWAADLSGEVGQRPTLGIAIRLTWPDGSSKKVLLGCVHIVSSHKADKEVYDVLKYVDEMKVRTGSDGWLLVGDFNCPPERMIQYITSQKTSYGPMTTCYPATFHTHDSGSTLDYILASSDAVLNHVAPTNPQPGVIPVQIPQWQAFPGETWLAGVEAKSDHKLVCYYQDNGPTVQPVNTGVL